MNELFYSFFLFVRIRVIRGHLGGLIRGSVLCLAFIASQTTKAGEAPSYKGLVRIPIDLITADGVRLERGQYELEVRPDVATYSLTFSSGGHVKAVVKPVPQSDTALASASIPIVGTHYLRASTEPVLTGEERRFSKTGRAQYEEETRDWKATLRVYRSQGNAVSFVFQSRGSHRHWDRLNFKLAQP
jgi:hypothetical protein